MFLVNFVDLAKVTFYEFNLYLVSLFKNIDISCLLFKDIFEFIIYFDIFIYFINVLILIVSYSGVNEKSFKDSWIS